MYMEFFWLSVNIVLGIEQKIWNILVDKVERKHEPNFK